MASVSLTSVYAQLSPFSSLPVKTVEKMGRVWSVIQSTPSNLARRVKNFAVSIFYQKKTLTTVSKENRFAHPMEVSAISNMASFLNTQDFFRFAKTTSPVLKGLKEVNVKLNPVTEKEISNITQFLRSINAQQFSQEIAQFEELSSPEKLLSTTLNQAQRQRILNKEIIRVLRPVWEANEQLRNHEAIAFSFAIAFEERESPTSEGKLHVLPYVSNLSENLLQNFEFMLKVVKQNGLALQWASPELKNDKALALAAVKQNGYALHYASEPLQDDREVVEVAIANGRGIIGTHEEDEEEFEKQRSGVLGATSPALRNDRQIVLAALAKNKAAVEFASDELKDDWQFMLEVVKINFYSLHEASNRLKADPNFIFAAMKINTSSFLYASEGLKDNPTFILAAMKIHSYAISDASDRLKNDPDFMLKACKLDYIALHYASDTVKDDRDIVLVALDHPYSSAYKDASIRLKKDNSIQWACSLPSFLGRYINRNKY
jgi:hypothetical protein